MRTSAVVLALFWPVVSGFSPLARSGLRTAGSSLVRRHVQTPASQSGDSSKADSEIATSQLQELRQEYLRAVDDLTAKKAALLEVEEKLNVVADEISDPWDYNFGFISRSTGIYTDLTTGAGNPAGPPPNIFATATKNFRRELNWIVAALRGEEEQFQDDPNCSDRVKEFRMKLKELRLDNDAVWAREAQRPKVPAPLTIFVPYTVLCWVLDGLFDGRPIQRFWFLETVARMPYFSYISMLHLYESLGWWRRSAETKRVHFAEEWNEYHHLLIMESLGGDQMWSDRFLAQHAAVFYYWVLILMWSLSPSLAYNFSELIEAHAVDTYAEFVEENEDILRSLPAPKIARDYYTAADLYFFDEFQTSSRRGERRPEINSLYDVFANIRDDEKEHAATMSACQDKDVVVTAPRTEFLTAAGVVAAIALNRYFSSEVGQEAVADFSERLGISAAIDAMPFLGGIAALLDKSSEFMEGFLRLLPKFFFFGL
mmetsp:Transcript_2078/g.9125  ORF Transcript_2078/g.9125 Transcript_2078/m.9125 type:complete len:485 (-) Transcript_2078:90-1544(-)